jgi:hypothetical protein
MQDKIASHGSQGHLTNDKRQTITGPGSLAQQTQRKLSFCSYTAEGAMRQAMVSLQVTATRARQERWAHLLTSWHESAQARQKRGNVCSPRSSVLMRMLRMSLSVGCMYLFLVSEMCATAKVQHGTRV